MSATLVLLLILAATLLIALTVTLWRVWVDYSDHSATDEEIERELASLNDAQANRISDAQLTRPVDPDTAWQTMVERGGSKRRQRGRR